MCTSQMRLYHRVEPPRTRDSPAMRWLRYSASWRRRTMLPGADSGETAETGTVERILQSAAMYTLVMASLGQRRISRHTLRLRAWMRGISRGAGEGQRRGL